jgi:two-component system, chemotaxis family, chemotaxis protein CheV
MGTKGMKSKILLESGTNEVEIAEFFLGERRFGINIAKIKEFYQYTDTGLTKIPESPSALKGVFLLRNTTIPLIDLKVFLDLEQTTPSERPVILVTEFNSLINGFLIDHVNQIHRLSWKDLSPLSPVLAQHSPAITGSVHVDENEILILDVEQIVAELFPQKMANFTELIDNPELAAPTAGSLSNIRLVLAEDSHMARKIIIRNLRAAGIEHIDSFDNGLAAYEHVLKLLDSSKAGGDAPAPMPDIIISDIEMPRMDGLTLCKKLKSELSLKIPIILFSSLINDQLAIKCQKVGANAQISKPEARKLIEKIEALCL